MLWYIFAKGGSGHKAKTMPTQGLSPLYLIDILVFVKKYIYKKELKYKEKNIYN